MAMWSFWNPEKQLVIVEQTAVLQNVDAASHESSACTGKVSESRDDGSVLALHAGKSQSSFASFSPRLLLRETKQKKEQKNGVSQGCRIGIESLPCQSLQGK